MSTSLGFVRGVAWETESPFLVVDYEARNALGVPTLKHLATKKILSDQRNLDQEHFRHIPWPIAAQLWQHLTRSGKMTLYMWKIFCAAYPDQFRQVSQSFRVAVQSPRFPLTGGYIELIKSSDCSWATSLTVWTEYAQVPELVKLADVANLVSLEINTSITVPNTGNDKSTATLNDRILRTWSELAETSKAFRHLRVLKLFGQSDITAQSYLYLSKLPSLEYCALASCDRITQKSAIKVASSKGWFRHQINPNHSICQFSTPDTSNPFETQSEELATHVNGPVSSTLLTDTPLLEFCVGTRSERVKDRDVVFLQRMLDVQGSLVQGQKRSLVDTVSPSTRDSASRKVKKPAVMKQRGKDLCGLLAEFG